MSHKEQMDFVSTIKTNFPMYFSHMKVLEVGSLDVNGSVRKFFDDCKYIGCDLNSGKGVDIICPAHELKFENDYFNCIISCESFEHDKYLQLTLHNIVRMLSKNGLFIFTCATTGRKEHGTIKNDPSSSPFTNDFYMNRVEDDFEIIKENFNEYKFDIINTDLRFYGIR